MNRRNFHVLTIIFFTGFFLGAGLAFRASADQLTHRYLNHFHRVYQIIRTDYVAGVDSKTVFYGAIKGMLKSLEDPFSQFLDEKSFNELKEMTTGKFVGVGLEITVREGEAVVITPIDDSPAMRAGIMAGDVILKVNGHVLKEMNLQEIVDKIKDSSDEYVEITVKRQGFFDPLGFKLKKDQVKIKSVAYDAVEGSGFYFLKINNFGAETAEEVESALDFFQSRKVKGLIVDLRNNPGGLFDSAVAIADLFLEKGSLIVSTKGREGTQGQNIFVSERNPVYSGKLVLLVNKGSASSSEILAGALRDHGRAVLVGEKTFGKGSVQKTYNLDEKLGIKITVARYYTPSGEMIHEKGIVPDLKVQGKSIPEKEIKELRKIGEDALWNGFFDKSIEYTVQSREKFYSHLIENKIEISRDTSDYILRNKIFSYRKRPLFDSEFDPQFTAAIEKLGADE